MLLRTAKYTLCNMFLSPPLEGRVLNSVTELYNNISNTFRSSHIALSRECSQNLRETQPIRNPCSRRHHTLNLFVCNLPQKVANPLYKSTVNLFVSFAIKLWRLLPPAAVLFLTDYYRISFPHEEPTHTVKHLV